MEQINQSKVSNRRSSPRRAARKSVKIECRKGTMGLGPNLAVETLDVSETGIRLALTSALAVKDEVEVRIEGLGFKAIKRSGNVLRVEPLEEGRWSVGIRLQSAIPYAEIQKLVRPS